MRSDDHAPAKMPGDDWQQFANLRALVGMGSAPKYTEVPCEFRIDLGQQTTGFFVNAMDPLSDLELMSPPVRQTGVSDGNALTHVVVATNIFGGRREMGSDE